MFGRVFEMTTEEISTAATLLLGIVGLMILFKISQPMNTFRKIVWGLMVTGMLICVIFMKDLFAIAPLTKKSAMTLVIFSIATEPLLRYISRFTVKLRKRILRRRAKKHSH